ncbi:BH0510 [Halalkalibacterium halodurans C-125]|uniref:BH0510 protein n=1 Tax=Halalkalibacterium halodurans (strain ATCC BAA-125 / DSM 18197 / FERM 7344 / JCM 9153 / C-125) TaxID=272558 RepID=Q9KFG9_HALH5|nr:BH0510 [Halalkalibacterium halodurans C-125]
MRLSNKALFILITVIVLMYGFGYWIIGHFILTR